MSKRLTIALLMLAACAPPRAKPQPKPTGINHRIEDTFNKVMSTKALDAVLPSGWKLDKFASGADSLTLGFLDGSGTMHSVELLLKPPSGESLPEKGRFFTFRPAKTETSENQQTLIRAARIVDANTSIEALVAETPKAPPKQGWTQYIETTTPPVVIALGIVQIVIVIGGIGIALVHGRRRDETRS